jgi:hypothetical protein
MRMASKAQLALWGWFAWPRRYTGHSSGSSSNPDSPKIMGSTSLPSAAADSAARHPCSCCKLPIHLLHRLTWASASPSRHERHQRHGWPASHASLNIPHCHAPPPPPAPESPDAEGRLGYATAVPVAHTHHACPLSGQAGLAGIAPLHSLVSHATHAQQISHAP